MGLEWRCKRHPSPASLTQLLTGRLRAIAIAPHTSLQVAYLSLFDQALDDTQVRWECGQDCAAAAARKLCLAGAQCGNSAG